MSDSLGEQAAGVGSLAEPVRRALYLYVVAQPGPVSREQAADAVGVPLHSAKFHLDRLVSEGLLEVEFRRLTGRTGPGAGRPSKLYRRSPRELSVTLPERRYDLAGEVLAAAVERSIRDGTPVADAVRDAAQEAGRRIAATGRGPRPRSEAGTRGASTTDSGRTDPAGKRSVESDLVRTAELLAQHGYEPRTSDGEICLANCPFDRLATQHTELVCGMNLALIGGVLAELGVADLTAALAPQPGLCCVKVRG